MADHDVESKEGIGTTFLIKLPEEGKAIKSVVKQFKRDLLIMKHTYINVDDEDR